MDTRWQYKIVTAQISRAAEEANHLGADGWDMVNSWEEAISLTYAGYPHIRMVFKRDLTFDHREEARRRYAELLEGVARNAKTMLDYPDAPGPKERIRENLAEMGEIEAQLGDPIAMIFKSVEVPGGA